MASPSWGGGIVWPNPGEKTTDESYKMRVWQAANPGKTFPTRSYKPKAEENMTTTTEEILKNIQEKIDILTCNTAPVFMISGPQKVTVGHFQTTENLVGVMNRNKDSRIGESFSKPGTAIKHFAKYGKSAAIGEEKLKLIGAYEGKKEPLIFVFSEHAEEGDMMTFPENCTLEMPAGQAFSQLEGFTDYIDSLKAHQEPGIDPELLIKIQAENEAARLAANPLIGSW